MGQERVAAKEGSQRPRRAWAEGAVGDADAAIRSARSPLVRSRGSRQGTGEGYEEGIVSDDVIAMKQQRGEGGQRSSAAARASASARALAARYSTSASSGLISTTLPSRQMASGMPRRLCS